MKAQGRSVRVKPRRPKTWMRLNRKPDMPKHATRQFRDAKGNFAWCSQFESGAPERCPLTSIFQTFELENSEFARRTESMGYRSERKRLGITLSLCRYVASSPTARGVMSLVSPICVVVGQFATRLLLLLDYRNTL